MNSRVLGAQQSQEWRAALEKFPETDTYFLPEYHVAYEANGDGTAKAFIVEDQGDLLFYPFMMRHIENIAGEVVTEPWYDIETVYGYSGPLSSTTDAGFLGRAWQEFSRWCHDERIVAEFIRFNPLMKNHEYMDETCQVELDRETVAIRLDCTEEELWSNYRKGHRSKVRKAISGGLVCEEVALTDGISQFRELYDATMDRSEAGQYYHFSDAYFDHLCTGLSDSLKLFTVRDGDHLVAATMFLATGDRIHAHLGGSEPGYQQLRPNNLLIHTMATWGRERGYRWLHLGGGRTADPDDTVYRFKASISRLRVPFNTGKRIHNQHAYQSLCSQWTRQMGESDRPSYFLLYRLGD